jgi:hypothetical protein
VGSFSFFYFESLHNFVKLLFHILCVFFMSFIT